MVILIAVDEDYLRETLVGALKYFGYGVEAASDGESLENLAEKLISQEEHCLFVVDNQMPARAGAMETQWCGFDRVAGLCEKHPPISGRVLFLSRWGLGDLDDVRRARARSLGLDDEKRWLSVHIPFHLLITRIENLRDGR
jgi:CheY-like chemotaxis protein